jgi:hypothetical protein
MGVDNFRKISTRGLVALIQRDFKPPTSSWITSMNDWIVDAMQGIGFHAGLVRKYKQDHPVCSHKAEYPCDLDVLIHVLYKGSKLPANSSTLKNLIPTQSGPEITHSDLAALRKLNEQKSSLLKLIGDSPDDVTLLESLDEVNLKISKEATFIGDYRTPTSISGMSYALNNSCIVTSFSEGTIDLVYDAFPVDDQGFIHIPDIYEYKQAVVWFVVTRMMMGGFKHPIFDFQYADQKWEMFRHQAENYAKYPSLDEMEAFTNMWTRAKFERNLAPNMFEGGHNVGAVQNDIINNFGY